MNNKKIILYIFMSFLYKIYRISDINCIPKYYIILSNSYKKLRYLKIKLPLMCKYT